MTDEQMFKASVQDIFFRLRQLRHPYRLAVHAGEGRGFPGEHSDIKVVIGGYCDERGSNEYNIVLGQNRAQSTKTALVTAGVRWPTASA